MKCLGIESTAHTFSCAVIDKRGKRGDILSDIRKIYGPPDGEGIHPREASRHHVENSSAVLVQALREAKISVTDLDIISYAAGPGLGPCLRVGAVVSRALSSYYKIPIYPVRGQILQLRVPNPQIRGSISYGGMYVVSKADGTTLAGTTEEHEGESWNDRYGFGIIDGGMVASGMLGAEQNASSEGPTPPLAGHWVEIENPVDESWVVQGQTPFGAA